MTNEGISDALNGINRAIKYKVEELNDPFPNVWSAALYACKEALEKQIPTLPKEDKGIYYCPECEKRNVKSCVGMIRRTRSTRVDFCFNCGQAIDWSDNDDE